MRLILTLRNFPFTPAVPDSNYNMLIYYTFTLAYTAAIFVKL